MKIDVLNREFDKLVEGRTKRLSKINLKEELDFMESEGQFRDSEGKEVFGE